MSRMHIYRWNKTSQRAVFFWHDATLKTHSPNDDAIAK